MDTTQFLIDGGNRETVFTCPACEHHLAHIFVIDHASNGTFGHWSEVWCAIVEDDSIIVEDYGDKIDDPENFADSLTGDKSAAPDPPDYGGCWFEDCDWRCGRCRREIDLERLAEELTDQDVESETEVLNKSG